MIEDFGECRIDYTKDSCIGYFAENVVADAVACRNVTT